MSHYEADSKHVNGIPNYCFCWEKGRSHNTFARQLLHKTYGLDNKAIENLFSPLCCETFATSTVCLKSIKSGAIKSMRIREKLFYILSAVNSTIKMILLPLSFASRTVAIQTYKMLSNPIVSRWQWKSKLMSENKRECGKASRSLTTFLALKTTWFQRNVEDCVAGYQLKCVKRIFPKSSAHVLHASAYVGHPQTHKRRKTTSVYDPSQITRVTIFILFIKTWRKESREKWGFEHLNRARNFICVIFYES